MPDPGRRPAGPGTGHHLPGERSPRCLPPCLLSPPLPRPGSPARRLASASSTGAAKVTSRESALLASERNAILIEGRADFRCGRCGRWSHPLPTVCACVLATSSSRFRDRQAGRQTGGSRSDLWPMHSSGPCQANITMSQWSVWHSITTRGCDRTSPFPLASLRAVSDIASLLRGKAVYFTCLHTWILYIWVPLSRLLSSST